MSNCWKPSGVDVYSLQFLAFIYPVSLISHRWHLSAIASKDHIHHHVDPRCVSVHHHLCRQKTCVIQLSFKSWLTRITSWEDSDGVPWNCPNKTSTTHSSKTQQNKRTGHYTPLCPLDWFFPEFIFPTFPTSATVNICSKSSGCEWCPCWDNTLQSIDGRCNPPDLRHLRRGLCMPSVQCEIIRTLWNQKITYQVAFKNEWRWSMLLFYTHAKSGETLQGGVFPAVHLGVAITWKSWNAYWFHRPHWVILRVKNLS